ncbi:MAG: hypothetical protein JXR68_13195 [Bacteroidales bacterium]|nr:hypothetical protein [Bacteroidales bacterium]
MKKKFLILIVFSLFTSKAVISQDFTNALEYLEYIDQKQQLIAQDMWTYISTSAHSNSDKRIQNKKSQLLQTISTAKTDVSRMPAFNGSTSLRDSMVDYLNFSTKLLNGDLTEIEVLEFNAKKSYAAMITYLDKVKLVNQKFSDHGNRLTHEYEKFAALNNIQLNPTSSQLAAKMQLANIVNDYYNSVYLICFKGFIAENFINQAINDNDTTALKQWTDSLITAVDEGNIAIKTISAYNGDMSLKFACQKSLNNFKLEADTYLPKIANYFKAQNNLNIAKANYNSKPQNQVTQNDVDVFNKAVNDYNNAIEIYNEYSQKLSKHQQDNSKQWNDASDKFLDQNIPK